MANDATNTPAITCWSCGVQVPLARVKMLDGERIVTCGACGKTNSLDPPGGRRP